MTLDPTSHKPLREVTVQYDDEDKPVTTFPAVPAQSATARALSVAALKANEWTARRDDLIRQAVAEGGTLREVGALAGLSHTAIKLICERTPAEPWPTSNPRHRETP